MFWIRVVESAAAVPGRLLVSMYWCASGILQRSGHVHQVPGHESGVAVGEIVFRVSGARVQVGRSGASFAQPSCIRLEWDDIAEVL